MKDARVLAFINLHAILGSIPQLCEIVPQANELIQGENVRLGISVKNGPSATLCFKDGICTLEDGAEKCDIKLPFSSPEKFNGMIDGTVQPFPSKGFTRLGFLTKKFTKLTEILTSYLKATDEDLADEDFFLASTKIMLHLIASAAAQIGNEDKVGKVSASNIDDGIAAIIIGDIESGYAVGVEVRNNVLNPIHKETERYTSFMRFESFLIARDIFDGKANAVAAVGLGQVEVGGVISQVDNLNRILDRVAFYLAD